MALTNEDLLAISEIMDAKLKSELRPLRNDMQEVKDELHIVKGEIQVIKSDVKAMNDGIQVIKSDMKVMNDEIQVMKGDMKVMNDEIQVMKGELRHVKLYQENVIVPRLDTIESCYTGTYQRYQNQADRMEAAYDDIDLLKKVTAEHSEKLQKLA